MSKAKLHDFSVHSFVLFASIGLLAMASSCSTPVPVGSGAAGDSGALVNHDAVTGASETTLINLPDSGGASPLDGGICIPSSSCKVGSGQYCGLIGDGCGGNLQCGLCPVGQSCFGGVCGTGTDYDAGALTSCTVTGGTYCGVIGDGAGGKLTCGACPTDWTCTSGLCTGDPIKCAPRSCGSGASKYCGTIGDDCGHAKDCGGCAADQVCTNNQCVPAKGCVAATCTPTGGQYCGGQLGDGCGGSITCGACTQPGWTCQDHLCKGDASCSRIACGTGSGKYCDTIGDGCGGSSDCGTCIPGEICKNNQCMKASCTPLTCNPTGGQYCGGLVGDGCGAVLSCGAACPAGWTCQDHLCVGDATCKKVTACTNGTSFNYCGDVGDNCGGVLPCGDDCATGQVCDTTTGLCKGDARCVPATCDNGSLFNYCGDVGDGCGGTLHCGNDCDKGQTCDTTTSLCKGDATCIPVACDNGTSFKYCGENGNGCGGSLHCGNDCDAHQVCGSDGICKGDATCAPVTCSNGTPFSYCGDIGDGCGGAVKCGARCGANQVCGAEGLCKGDSTCVPRSCDNGTNFKYCGIVGDGCGGALSCGNNCGAGKVCDPKSNLCHGDTTCIPIASCDNGTNYPYCGTIGDGCGGSLVCSTTCGAGKTCDTTTGVCKGDDTCRPLASCTNGTAFNYCGKIGDGCGDSLTCSTVCGTGKSCDTTTGLCKGDTTCTPLTACTNGTAFNYCGAIGDGCGGSLTCSTACGTGKICDTTTGLCKGDNTCTPLAACTNGTAFNYCGTVGDGCGGSLVCGSDCTTNQVCDTTRGLCKSNNTCTPLTACTNSTAFNYCGTIGDGCGGSLVCGSDCAANQVCDTSKGLCKGNDSCVRTVSPTCTAANGGTYCGGPIGDGCGGAITCPATCPTGFSCQNNACVCTSTSCGMCSGLQCQIAKCDAGSTTIKGKVFTPAGAPPAGDPVYNALVFIPNGALPPITSGPSCDKCTALTSDQAIAGTISGPDGSFTISNAPTGTGIPLVVQLGKWRRQITIDVPTSCGDNHIADGTVRLPKNQGEGNIPLTAVTTGSSDALECVLKKMGIDTAEFQLPTTVSGRIKIYKETGASFTSGTTPGADTLWGGTGTNGGTGKNGQPGLSSYDMVLLPCPGDSPSGANNPSTPGAAPSRADTDAAGYPNLLNYTAVGGRAFVTHYSWKFIAPSRSPFPATANWSMASSSTNPTPEVQETRYYAGGGSTNPPSYLAVTATANIGFAKGAGFAQWLVNIGAGTLAGGVTTMTLNNVAHVANSVIEGTTSNPISQAWLTSPLAWRQFQGGSGVTCNDTTHGSNCIQHQFAHEFSFNTPVGAATDHQCGRVVFSGFHVNQPSSGTTPGYCTGAMTAQEKVLMFMMLDLSSCISIDPPPPIVIPPPPSTQAPPPPPPPAPPPPPSSPAAPAPPPAPSPPPPAAPPPPPPASPPPPTAPAAPPPPPAPAPPAPPPPATSPPAPPSPPVPPPPPPPPPVAAPPPPAPPPPAAAPPPPPPPPPTPPSFIP